MTTQIKITQTVVTSQYGSLSNGDVLRTTQAFAKHLVEECNAAEYIDIPIQDNAQKVVKVSKKVKKAIKNDNNY